MTRVEEDRAQQRYEEQKRLEKQQNQAKVRGADDFKKVVASKQDNQAKITRRQQPNANMSKQQQSSSKKGQAQTKLLAKSGFQSRDLQSELMKRSDRAIEQHQTDHKERDLDLHQKQDVEMDRQVTQSHDDAKRTQAQSDRLAAIAGDEKRKGSENESSQSGDMGGGQMGMPMGSHSPQQTTTSETKGSAGGARIPENALRALVKLCQVRVNPKGLTEFSIELRDDVLAGSKMNISANGRRISATFVSDDANTRRLLKASEGDLARAFDNAGLSLENFRVSAF